MSNSQAETPADNGPDNNQAKQPNPEPNNPEELASGKVKLWTRPYVMVLALNLFSSMGAWMLPNFLPVYIHSLGAPNWMLGWLTGAASIASIMARPVSGQLVDRFGRRGILVVGVVGMALSNAALIFMPLVGAILAMRFIQGIFWGATNTSTTTIVTDVLPKSRFAEGMGYFGMCSSVGLVIAPALSLWLYYNYGEKFSVGATSLFFVGSFILSFFVVAQRRGARTTGARA
ncbi:MAG: MFS transporter, partial [Bifidobacteriaceae bacterium]|nr:MFS transporter [Bifidobacteriaceae bacterium]